MAKSIALALRPQSPKRVIPIQALDAHFQRFFRLYIIKRFKIKGAEIWSWAVNFLQQLFFAKYQTILCFPF
uniref:Uncharacterized protein n=1 Tax=Lepeophtheirus salmonis TaxID=72036 RepID=A0A0K2UMU2_LEPSM